MKLLKKEFRLCMHPTVYLMALLSAMVLIPNYPYAVSFFYVTLSLFFVCITARENHDAAYTLTLPVSRGEMVKGRALLFCCVEMAQMILCGLCILLKNRMIGDLANAAGMDANVALLGEGFLVYGLFHLVFLPMLYRDLNKVGKAFAIASIAVFVYIVVAVSCTYALPFVRDNLDTPDPAHMTEKLVFLAVCACWYVFATALSVRIAAKRFEQLDLQL